MREGFHIRTNLSHVWRIRTYLSHVKNLNDSSENLWSFWWKLPKILWRAFQVLADEHDSILFLWLTICLFCVFFDWMSYGWLFGRLLCNLFCSVTRLTEPCTMSFVSVFNEASSSVTSHRVSLFSVFNEASSSVKRPSHLTLLSYLPLLAFKFPFFPSAFFQPFCLGIFYLKIYKTNKFSKDYYK